MDPKSFCYVLKGFLQGKSSLDREDTAFVKDQLNNVFQHVIDKQYPTDNGKSQAIHDGNKPVIYPDGVRC